MPRHRFFDREILLIFKGLSLVDSMLTINLLFTIESLVKTPASLGDIGVGGGVGSRVVAGVGAGVGGIVVGAGVSH